MTLVFKRNYDLFIFIIILHFYKVKRCGNENISYIVVVNSIPFEKFL